MGRCRAILSLKGTLKTPWGPKSLVLGVPSVSSAVAAGPRRASVLGAAGAGETRDGHGIFRHGRKTTAYDQRQARRRKVGLPRQCPALGRAVGSVAQASCLRGGGERGFWTRSVFPQPKSGCCCFRVMRERGITPQHSRPWCLATLSCSPSPLHPNTKNTSDPMGALTLPRPLTQCLLPFFSCTAGTAAFPVQAPESCLPYPWATEKYGNVSLICNAIMFRDIEVIMY